MPDALAVTQPTLSNTGNQCLMMRGATMHVMPVLLVQTSTTVHDIQLLMQPCRGWTTTDHRGHCSAT